MARPIGILTALEGVGIAFDAVRSNKARAALTILGVAVGVFVVVAMSAAVNGISASVARDLESIGPTSFYVYRIPISRGSVCDGSDEMCPWRRNPPVTVEEAAMVGRLPSVGAVTAHLGDRQPFTYKDRTLASAGLDAYSPAWTDVDAGDIYPGRSFTEAENQIAARVVIINDKMAEQLFGASDPLDKFVLVGSVSFRVIGIYHYTASFLGRPGSSSTGDEARAIIPIETGRRVLNLSMRWLDLIVKPRAGVPQIEAIDEVTALLRAHRGLRPAQDNTFATVTSETLMSIYNGFIGAFFVVMIALSGAGLMVGGVGVVAIMMISVTERTREIGVRKALGATRLTILWQFLVEAATLTSIGAAVGLVTGALVTLMINRFTPVPAAIPTWSIFASLGASAFTGILFGMLPATRAARLDPVAALRDE